MDVDVDTLRRADPWVSRRPAALCGVGVFSVVWLTACAFAVLTMDPFHAWFAEAGASAEASKVEGRALRAHSFRADARVAGFLSVTFCVPLVALVVAVVCTRRRGPCWGGSLPRPGRSITSRPRTTAAQHQLAAERCSAARRASITLDEEEEERICELYAGSADEWQPNPDAAARTGRHWLGAAVGRAARWARPNNLVPSVTMGFVVPPSEEEDGDDEYEGGGGGWGGDDRRARTLSVYDPWPVT